MNTVADPQTQTTLLDISGREFNVMFVDENQPLFVANNPLHWKLQKLQIAAARLEKQAEKNPAQFNSTTYIATIDKMSELMEQINNQWKATNDEQSVGSDEMAEGRDEGSAPSVGERNAPSLDFGVSADNPFAG